MGASFERHRAMMVRSWLGQSSQRVALTLAAFALWSLFALVHAHVKAADFYVFWDAGRHWRAPYDPGLIRALESRFHVEGAWPFAYPPTFLLLVWPFAQAPLALAYPLWTGLSAALFIFAAAHVVRPPWAALGLFIVPPVVLAIAPGQTSLIVGAAMIGGFQLADRRPALAGLLFAVAACIKPQAMLLAPIVLWGQWRVVGWTALGAAALGAASLVFGPGLWLQWPHALETLAQVAPGTDRVNPTAVGGAALSLALAGLGLLIAWRERTLAGLVAGGLCLTPYAHQYDLAPLAPAALGWILERKALGWPRALCGAALLAGLVSGPLGAVAFVAGMAASGRPRESHAPAPGPAAVSEPA